MLQWSTYIRKLLSNFVIERSARNVSIRLSLTVSHGGGPTHGSHTIVCDEKRSSTTWERGWGLSRRKQHFLPVHQCLITSESNLVRFWYYYTVLLREWLGPVILCTRSKPFPKLPNWSWGTVICHLGTNAPTCQCPKMDVHISESILQDIY